MMAIVFDVAIRSEERRQLQNATDFAALAAALLLPSDPAGAEALAITYLDENGVDVSDPNVRYTFDWPSNGNQNQVAMTVVRERATLFVGAFGIDKMRPDANAIAERITLGVC
jgi:Flp pilus assembly protein TadG